jgi:hypothetical protein
MLHKHTPLPLKYTLSVETLRIPTEKTNTFITKQNKKQGRPSFYFCVFSICFTGEGFVKHTLASPRERGVGKRSVPTEGYGLSP